MKITQTRVKQYNSTYKTVISVDGIPVCITRSNKRASDIVSYLSGYEAEINDGKLKKQLDKIKDKKQQFQTERMVDFMKTVELLLNDYIGDNYNPSRQTKFTITEECLTDYLKETEDDRNVKTFLDTYDSDESSVIYDYAANDGRILSEEITYCDDFVDRYEDFIRRTQMFNPDMSAEDISSKEDYYWTVYKAQ